MIQKTATLLMFELYGADIYLSITNEQKEKINMTFHIKSNLV